MADGGGNVPHLLCDGEPVATGQEAIVEAARLLQIGEVVAIPTDTVYGLAADLIFAAALGKIFRIKGRERTQTLPVLVPDQSAAGRLLRHDGDESLDGGNRLLALADLFWPGGLTVALPAGPGLPKDVVAADGTVGLRIPGNDVTLNLLQIVGGALAVTSANRSGELPLTDAGRVVRELSPAGLRWVLDGGPSGTSVASTVIGQIGSDLVIHRQGAIAERDLRRAWVEIIGARDDVAG